LNIAALKREFTYHQRNVMNILLAVDDSQYSADAVEAVAARPWPPNTIVRVLSAVQVPFTPGAEVSYAGNLGQVLKEMTKYAEELTARVADSLRTKGLTAEPVVREGDPRSLIVDEAKQWPADLIILGSHGRSGLKRWLLGSVSQSVASYAPCSVEVVRKKSVDEIERE
jgi:nucleotide-binding universal stress UspA family protein